MTAVLTRRGDERDTETHREESHAVTEAETGVLLPQAKESQGLPAATRIDQMPQAKESQGLPAATRIDQRGVHGTDSPFKSPRRNQSSISDFWPPKL